MCFVPYRDFRHSHRFVVGGGEEVEATDTKRERKTRKQIPTTDYIVRVPINLHCYVDSLSRITKLTKEISFLSLSPSSRSISRRTDCL